MIKLFPEANGEPIWYQWRLPWWKRVIWRILGKKIVGVDIGHDGVTVKITGYWRNGEIVVTNEEFLP